MKNFCMCQERTRPYNAKQILIKVENGFRLFSVSDVLMLEGK